MSLDLTALASAGRLALDLQHNAKVVALAVLAFYILGDAIFTMLKEKDYLNWHYAVNYIRKFADVYLGLAVMAVVGQFVPAVDLVFWASIGIYSKSELTDLIAKVRSLAAPVA